MPERFRWGLSVCLEDLRLAALSVLAIGAFNALLVLMQKGLCVYFNCVPSLRP